MRQRLCPASSNGHRAGRRDRRTDGRRERDRAGNHQRNHDRHPRPLRHKRQKPPVRPDLLVYRHGAAEHHGRQQHRSAGRAAAGCDPDRERRRADRLRRRPEEKRRRLAGRAEHVRDHQIKGHELYGCAPRPHGRRAGQLQFGRTRRGHRHYDPRRQLDQRRNAAAVYHRRRADRHQRRRSSHEQLHFGQRALQSAGGHQPVGHRVDQRPQGCVGDGHLRIARSQRRRDHHDQKRARRKGLRRFRHERRSGPDVEYDRRASGTGVRGLPFRQVPDQRCVGYRHQRRRSARPGEGLLRLPQPQLAGGGHAHGHHPELQHRRRFRRQREDQGGRFGRLPQSGGHRQEEPDGTFHGSHPFRQRPQQAVHHRRHDQLLPHRDQGSRHQCGRQLVQRTGAELRPLQADLPERGR